MRPSQRPSHCTVLELGASHVARGMFGREQGELRLLGYAEERLAWDATRDAQWVERAAAAIRKLAPEGGARVGATLVLPGHLVLTKHVKVPSVAAKTRDRVAAFEAAQAIPWPLDEVLWEHVFVGDDGRETEIRFTAVKREPVHRLCAEAEAAGFRIRAVRPACEALAWAQWHARAGDETLAMIADVGARSTNFLAGPPRHFRARTVGIGGDAITTALAEELGVSFAEAEALKCESRTSLPVPGLRGIEGRSVAAPAHALWEREAGRFLATAAAGSGLLPPTTLWLTGGGAQCAGRAVTLEQRLRIKVEMLDPLARVTVEPSAKVAGVPASALLATLVGAAVAEFEQAEGGAQLLPEPLRRELAFRRCQPTLLATAVAGALALAAPCWHYARTADRALARAAEIEAKVEPQRSTARNNEGKLAKLREVRTEMRSVRRLVESKSRWVEFLADLQERMEDAGDVWLDRLAIAPPPGLRLLLGGCMLDVDNPAAKVSPDSCERVSQFLDSLGDSPFVTEVKDERFDNARPGMLRFDVVLELDPQHPL